MNLDNMNRIKAICGLAGALLLAFTSLACQSNEAAAGSTGSIYAQTPSQNLRESFSEVIFLTRNRGLALGVSGNLWITTNSGQKWESVRQFKKSERYKFNFVNSQEGFLMIDEHLWSTTDSGATWISVTDFKDILESEMVNLDGIFFIDAKSGWAVGGKYSPKRGMEGLILETTDGGRSWNQQVIGDTQGIISTRGGKWDLRDVCFVNPKEGIAVGKGVVLSTRNGGELWQEVKGLEGIFEDVHFSSDKVGWILEKNREASLITVNGGRDWKQLKWPDANAADSVFMDSRFPSLLSKVTGEVLISHDIGTSWTSSGSETFATKKKPSDNFAYSFLNRAFDDSILLTRILIQEDGDSVPVTTVVR